MTEFIKKNIYLIFLFIITLSIGFLTFLTFIDKSFIKLTPENLHYLLVFNIFLVTVYLSVSTKSPWPDTNTEDADVTSIIVPTLL